MSKKFEFNKENYQKAKEIIAKYPQAREKSAVMGLLDLAQRQNNGWLTREAMDYIASIINIAPMLIDRSAILKTAGKYISL